MCDAEDPNTALGLEYKIMAQDLTVELVKKLLILRYRFTGKVEVRLLTANENNLSNVASLECYQDHRTGTHFFKLVHRDGRTLRFIIKRMEFEVGTSG